MSTLLKFAGAFAIGALLASAGIGPDSWQLYAVFVIYSAAAFTGRQA